MLGETHPDLPRHKEAIISRLFGEFVGFLKANGLKDGNEFATQTVPILQCSRKMIWIDDLNRQKKITVHFNSVQMFIEFGIVRKRDRKVLHRQKLENLRYKISTGEEVALIDSHQEKFDEFFGDFQSRFNELKPKPRKAKSVKAGAL